MIEAVQNLVSDVTGGEIAHHAEIRQNVPARGIIEPHENHRRTGAPVVDESHETGVDAALGQLVQHERAEGIRRRHEIIVSPSFRGNSAVITERRPPWREDFGPEWSSNRIAKLTVDPVANTWILFATDRNDRQLNYSRDVGVGASLVEILAELDADPTSIFWG